MGSSLFWLKVADEESKSIPHEFPRSHWLKATGQCVIERYLSATMYFTMSVYGGHHSPSSHYLLIPVRVWIHVFPILIDFRAGNQQTMSKR